MKQPKPLPDGFFNVTEKRAGYVKAGFVGAAGSGKSTTALFLAMGLYDKVVKKNKNAILYYFDTENSMDYYIPFLNEQNISWMAKTNSRNLFDLSALMDNLNATENQNILIVDSLSHIYNDMTERYKNKHKKSYLHIKDIMYLKSKWLEHFSNKAVYGNFHLIICGREGDKFEFVATGETKSDGKPKKEMVATDKKMRGDSETAFEFSFYCRMERILKSGLTDVREGKVQANVVQQLCTVLKDKSRLMHGNSIVNPKYSHFEGYVDFVTSGEEKTIEGLQKTENNVFENSPEERKQAKVIAEEIHDRINKEYPGSTADIRQKKNDLMQHIYGTTSKTKIYDMSLDEQQAAKDRLEEYFKALSEPPPLSENTDQKDEESQSDLPF